MTATHPFIEVARPLAMRAAARLMELRMTTLHKERKADHSIVTNADREADQIIRDGLRRAFPDHAILTEESGSQGSLQSEFTWVVDPLDGTKAYVNGTNGFAVMIGLLRRSEPFAGVVADPLEGHVYEAVRGEGACHRLNNVVTPMHVSDRHDWRKMPLISSTGFPEDKRKAIEKVLPCPWLPAVNSVGIKVGFVTRKLADIYINHHGVHYWDTCAPQIILEESGGRFSYIDGSPLKYQLGGTHRHTMSTLVTNNQRHDEVLAAIQPILKGHV